MRPVVISVAPVPGDARSARPEDVAREIERLAGGVRAEAARVGARKPRSVLS